MRTRAGIRGAVSVATTTRSPKAFPRSLAEASAASPSRGGNLARAPAIKAMLPRGDGVPKSVTTTHSTATSRAPGCASTRAPAGLVARSRCRNTPSPSAPSSGRGEPVPGSARVDVGRLGVPGMPEGHAVPLHHRLPPQSPPSLPGRGTVRQRPRWTPRGVGPPASHRPPRG